MSLGGLLVGRGLVTLDDIDAALERQRAEGGRLGDNLIDLEANIIDLRIIFRSVRKAGVEHVSRNDTIAVFDQGQGRTRRDTRGIRGTSKEVRHCE